ncbi:hypothetical protein [Malacoplasma muris]|uniref:hypothetical protein n=1 Tax=Malacoplasma muris TaxID=2119 RepID=UPI00398E57EE
MRNVQIKSKERVSNHGEVFTNEKEVKAMCDLVNNETQRIDSRFLEPACGDGNFLNEILIRKLIIVKNKYKKSISDYEKMSLLAVSSLYGIDLLRDNIINCINRLYKTWENEYLKISKSNISNEIKDSIKFILRKNIICGNALTFNTIDENGKETNEPIIFSEWSFIIGSNLQRSDYIFENLLNANNNLFNQHNQSTLLKKYITHYRKIKDYE